MKRQANGMFSTLDLYLSAFLLISGYQPNLEVQNGIVIFTFPNDDELYKLMFLYNSNADVKVGEFVTAVKTLRGQMLTLRNTR
jgi:hypothetical protein